MQRWVFDVARVELNFGERLRRMRGTAASREHLRNALDGFERLGADPWARRARAELGATGQEHRRGRTDSMTDQEEEIAMLAAAGMTNKEIGTRLFLSHRTVGAHLYRVFPKLGITSRAALRDALGTRPERGNSRKGA